MMNYGVVVLVVLAVAHAHEHSGLTVTELCPLDASSTTSPCKFEVRAAGGVYTINGEARPALTLRRGQLYVFEVETASVHNFAFGTGEDGPRYAAAGSGGVCDDAYADGEFVHATSLTLAPGVDTPAALSYYCTVSTHRGMGNTITVTGVANPNEAQACPAADAPPAVSNGSDEGSGDDADAAAAVDPNDICRGRSRSTLLIIHASVMYLAFGIMLPAAGFLAHIGRRFQIATRDRIGVRRYADLSAHIVLAPSAVLLGCGGVTLAVVAVQQSGSPHFVQSHSFIGLGTARNSGAILRNSAQLFGDASSSTGIISAALVIQPIAMATGFRSLHRRMGATIIAAGLANIFQGMYLLCVPLWVQIGQVVLIALVLIGYVLYRPPAAKRPAGAATSTTEVALDLTSPKALATSLDPSAVPAPSATPAPVGPADGAAAGDGKSLAGDMKAALIKQKSRRSEMGGGGGGNDGDDAEEAALRAALPAAVVEKRDASAPKGAISKAELIGLLGHVLKTNRLSLSKKDQAAVADAIFKEGDKDHDGHLHLDELNAMLSVREVRTGAGGHLERAPPKATEPVVLRNPGAKGADLIASLNPAFVGDGSPAEGAAPPSKLRKFGTRLQDSLVKVWWVALWGLANVACFVLHFGTYACWFAAEGEECAPAPWAVCVAKGAGMALNLSCAFVVLPMCRIFLTLLRKVRILLEHIDECVRPASPLSDPTSTLCRCGSSAGWCRSTRVTTSTSSSAGRSPGGHRRPVERGRGAPPRSPHHRPTAHRACLPPATGGPSSTPSPTTSTTPGCPTRR